MSSFENSKPCALVVDDDALLLMEASDILEDAGFRSLEAQNVDDAERLLEKYDGEIVLLFTDVQMNGNRNGFELARLTAARWPDISILVASGLADPEPDLLPDSAVFLRKPFSADVVYDRLQMLLPDGKKPEPLKKKTGQHPCV